MGLLEEGGEKGVVRVRVTRTLPRWAASPQPRCRWYCRDAGGPSWVGYRPAMVKGKAHCPGGERLRDGGFGPSPPHWLGMALRFYGGMALLALIWRGLAAGSWPWLATGAGGWPGVALAPEPALLPQPLWLRVASGLVVGGLMVWLSRLWIRRSVAGRRLAGELGDRLGPLSHRTAWGLALVSSIAEEMLFRGALQAQFGLLVASLLFGAAHFLPGPGLRLWSVYALGGGLALGALFEWTGDLLAPLLAHLVVNGLNLGWLGRHDAAAEQHASAPSL